MDFLHLSLPAGSPTGVYPGWLRDYHSGEPVGPVLFLALFSSPVRHPLPGFKRNSSINSVNPGGGPSRASTG